MTTDLFNVDDLEVEALETRYEMDVPQFISTCTGPPKPTLPHPPPSTCVIIGPH